MRPFGRKHAIPPRRLAKSPKSLGERLTDSEPVDEDRENDGVHVIRPQARLFLSATLAAAMAGSFTGPASGQTDFVAFESGPTSGSSLMLTPLRLRVSSRVVVFWGD